MTNTLPLAEDYPTRLQMSYALGDLKKPDPEFSWQQALKYGMDPSSTQAIYFGHPEQWKEIDTGYVSPYFQIFNLDELTALIQSPELIKKGMEAGNFHASYMFSLEIARRMGVANLSYDGFRTFFGLSGNPKLADGGSDYINVESTYLNNVSEKDEGNYITRSLLTKYQQWFYSNERLYGRKEFDFDIYYRSLPRFREVMSVWSRHELSKKDFQEIHPDKMSSLFRPIFETLHTIGTHHDLDLEKIAHSSISKADFTRLFQETDNYARYLIPHLASSLMINHQWESLSNLIHAIEQSHIYKNDPFEWISDTPFNKPEHKKTLSRIIELFVDPITAQHIRYKLETSTPQDLYDYIDHPNKMLYINNIDVEKENCFRELLKKGDAIAVKEYVLFIETVLNAHNVHEVIDILHNLPLLNTVTNGRVWVAFTIFGYIAPFKMVEQNSLYGITTGIPKEIQKYMLDPHFFETFGKNMIAFSTELANIYPNELPKDLHSLVWKFQSFIQSCIEILLIENPEQGILLLQEAEQSHINYPAIKETIFPIQSLQQRFGEQMFAQFLSSEIMMIVATKNLQKQLQILGFEKETIDNITCSLLPIQGIQKNKSTVDLESLPPEVFAQELFQRLDHVSRRFLKRYAQPTTERMPNRDLDTYPVRGRAEASIVREARLADRAMTLGFDPAMYVGYVGEFGTMWSKKEPLRTSKKYDPLQFPFVTIPTRNQVEQQVIALSRALYLNTVILQLRRGELDSARRVLFFSHNASNLLPDGELYDSSYKSMVMNMIVDKLQVTPITRPADGDGNYGWTFPGGKTKPPNFIRHLTSENRETVEQREEIIQSTNAGLEKNNTIQNIEEKENEQLESALRDAQSYVKTLKDTGRKSEELRRDKDGDIFRRDEKEEKEKEQKQEEEKREKKDHEEKNTSLPEIMFSLIPPEQSSIVILQRISSVVTRTVYGGQTNTPIARTDDLLHSIQAQLRDLYEHTQETEETRKQKLQIIDSISSALSDPNGNILNIEELQLSPREKSIVRRILQDAKKKK